MNCDNAIFIFSTFRKLQTKAVDLDREVNGFNGIKGDVKYESLCLRISDFQAELMNSEPEENAHVVNKEELMDRCKALFTDLKLKASSLSSILEQELIKSNKTQGEEEIRLFQEQFRTAVGK